MSVYSVRDNNISDESSNIDLEALDSDDLISNNLSINDSINSSYSNPFNTTITADQAINNNNNITNPPINHINTYQSSNLQSIKRRTTTNDSNINDNYSINDINALDDNNDYYSDDETSTDDDDDDEYNQDLVSNVGIDDDNESYKNLNNKQFNNKIGDKLKTTWQNCKNDEIEYKESQIIDEVSKLQNLNFFSNKYIENLENLKISQLGLLIEMVKLTDNSFDEFYNIWNNFNEKFINDDSKGNDNSEKVDNDINSKNSKNSTKESKENDEEIKDKKENKESNETNNNSNIEDNIDNNNDDDYQKEMEMVTWFNINESEGFKLMEQRKLEILNDLDKINNSIELIDSSTKSIWSKY